MMSRLIPIDPAEITEEVVAFVRENELEIEALDSKNDNPSTKCTRPAICIDGPLEGITFWVDQDSVHTGVNFNGLDYTLHYMRGTNGFEFQGWLRIGK